jgi:hypothetical protein
LVAKTKVCCNPQTWQSPQHSSWSMS